MYKFQLMLKTFVLISVSQFTLLSCSDRNASNVSATSPSPEYETYVQNVNRIEMKVTAPKASKSGAPLQLAVYLHGDTAVDYTGEYYANARNFAKTKGLVFAAIRAPNQRSWWSNDQNSFAFFDKELDEALGWLHQKYNIDKTKYLFSGVSGGSTFLTSVFVPAFGNKYPGAYVMNCGGARNDVRGKVTDLEGSKLKMYFYYGDQDFLVPVINNAMDGYRKLDVQVESEVFPNVTHCAFKTDQTTIKAWDMNLLPPGSSDNTDSGNPNTDSGNPNTDSGNPNTDSGNPNTDSKDDNKTDPATPIKI